MKNRNFALVGSWDWDDKNSKKGINVCDYDTKSGKLKLLQNYLPDVKVGCDPLLLDDHVYVVEEIKHTKKRSCGGGGYVIHGKLNDDLHLDIIDYKETLACNPCSCARDHSHRYLLVAHYTSSRDTVTKLKRDQDGHIYNEILYDDAALELFALHKDGRIGELLDFDVHEPQEDSFSLLHAVYPSPSNTFYVVFDKGLDKVYTYAVDDEKKKLLRLDELKLDHGCDPRYCVFHPKTNLLYSTNERKACVNVISFHPQSGKLKKVKDVFLGREQLKDDIMMSSDIRITPDGRHLYVAIRGIDRIAICDIDEEGIPIYRMSVDCNGRFPRGLAINKKGTILFSCNTESDNITSFTIHEDGSLTQKEVFEISRPANMTIVEEE